MSERFNAVNERLEALRERYDVAKDISILQAKVRELEGRLSAH